MSNYANESAGAVEREGACRGVRGMVKDTRSATLKFRRLFGTGAMAAPAQRASSPRGARPPAPHHPAGCSRRIRRAVEDLTGSFASPGRSPWTDHGWIVPWHKGLTFGLTLDEN